MKRENIEEKNKETNKKKKHPVLYTLIILMLGLVLGQLSAYYFLVVYAPNNKENIPMITVTKKETNETEVPANSCIIKELLNRLHYSDGTNMEKYLYANELTTLENLPNEYVNSIIINEAIRSNYTTNETYTIKDLETARDKVFGDSYLYIIPTDEYFGYCPRYIYNELDKVYNKTKDECDITSSFKIKRELLKATRTEQELYIYELVAFIEDDKIYKTTNSQGFLFDELEGTSVDGFVLKDNKDKLDTFKYTFKYNEETEKYVFKSIEKLKDNKNE